MRREALGCFAKHPRLTGSGAGGPPEGFRAGASRSFRNNCQPQTARQCRGNARLRQSAGQFENKRTVAEICRSRADKTRHFTIRSTLDRYLAAQHVHLETLDEIVGVGGRYDHADGVAFLEQARRSQQSALGRAVTGRHEPVAELGDVIGELTL